MWGVRDTKAHLETGTSDAAARSSACSRFPLLCENILFISKRSKNEVTFPNVRHS